MKTSTGMESGSSPRVMAKGNNDTNIPSVLQHLPLKVTEVSKDTIKNFPHTKRVGNYLLGRTLGEGSFAKVKEGLHVLTGEKVCMCRVRSNPSQNKYLCSREFFYCSRVICYFNRVFCYSNAVFCYCR